jgi:hypothetical protein
LDHKHKLHAHKQTLLPILTGKEHTFAVILTDLTPVYRSEVVTTILHRISHAVNIEVSLEDLFQIIHESLGRVIDVTNFYIALYDSKSNLITFPYLVDEMNEDSSPLWRMTARASPLRSSAKKELCYWITMQYWPEPWIAASWDMNAKTSWVYP